MAKINKKICIKTRDGNIQTISLYSEKNDVLKSGATNFLVVRKPNGEMLAFAALGDLDHYEASKLRYGNKVVLIKSPKYRMWELYPDIYTTMTRIPNEENIEFIIGNRRNLNRMFINCYNLTSVPLFNTSSVTSMNYMFVECHNLNSVPLFNTSSVTNMNRMFDYCHNLNSVPLFNTSSVTNMEGMFCHCYNLTSVPLFNTSSVTSMNDMFGHCHNLTSVPIFDIRNVKDIKNMLQRTKVTSVTFKNKPANLNINSKILCGDSNQIKTINFI